MARRIITAAIAIPVAVLIIMFDNEYLLCSVIAAFSVIAVYEMLLATKYLRNKVISYISLTFVAVLPYSLCIAPLKSNLVLINGIFIVSLLVVMLFMHSKVSFEEVSLVAFISITFPMAFSCIPLIRIKFEEHGIFCIVFLLVCAWTGDAGAYFVGTFLGKHKLAPQISPKKTVEGFFGGIAFSCLSGLVAAVVYENFAPVVFNIEPFGINKWYIVLIALVSSTLGVLGDLIASIIKRQCAVKDFGNIMPGHGGILDRFDSVLLVAPFVYHAFSYYSPFVAV